MVGRPLGVDASRRCGSPSGRRDGCASCPGSSPTASSPAYFRRADLVVLPYRDAEQSGVLFTALAFGKAIVLSDVGGFAEVAAHGAARLVPPEDPQALAAAIGDLLADRAARERLGRRGARPRRRPVLVGRGRRPDARALPETCSR